MEFQVDDVVRVTEEGRKYYGRCAYRTEPVDRVVTRPVNFGK